VKDESIDILFVTKAYMKYAQVLMKPKDNKSKEILIEFVNKFSGYDEARGFVRALGSVISGKGSWRNLSVIRN
jgi:hypothetical protein